MILFKFFMNLFIWIIIFNPWINYKRFQSQWCYWFTVSSIVKMKKTPALASVVVLINHKPPVDIVITYSRGWNWYRGNEIIIQTQPKRYLKLSLVLKGNLYFKYLICDYVVFVLIFVQVGNRRWRCFIYYLLLIVLTSLLLRVTFLCYQKK